MGLERFSVVRVPFPSTDRAVTQNRHGLVLSDVSFNTPAGHTVLAMINSQAPMALVYPLLPNYVSDFLRWIIVWCVVNWESKADEAKVRKGMQALGEWMRNRELVPAGKGRYVSWKGRRKTTRKSV